MVEATLQEIHPIDEVSRTFFPRAEYIFNSRSWNSTSSDSSDLASISLNNMSIGIVEIGIPGLFTKNDKIRRKQCCISRYPIEAYWKRWLQKYVPILLKRKKWTENHQGIKKGEIVLIGENNISRATWPL